MAKVMFNTKQVMAGFGVSDMTIFDWRRKGLGDEPLPCTIEGNRVSFAESDMKAWGKRHGRPFDSVAAAKVAGAAKPGPKVAAKAPAKKAAPVKKSAKVIPLKAKAPKRATASA